MTFQAYHRARRMGLALLDIRKGKTVIDSQLDQGFESGSGFREAFTRLVGTAPSRARDVSVLHAKWLETPLGSMLALADDRGLHLLDFVDRRGLERALAVLQKRLNARVLPGEHRYLAQIDARARRILRRHAADVRDAGRADRVAVPVARMAGAAGDSGRARRARTPSSRGASASPAPCARSAAPTATTGCRSSCPCHRVIGADGALTGYGGGLARKQKLLDLERAPPADLSRVLMPLRSTALLVVLAALWGGSFVFMRVAVPALGPVVARVRARRRSPRWCCWRSRPRSAACPPFRTRWRDFAVVGVVNSALPFVLFCYAEQYITRVDRRDPQRDEPVLRRHRRRDLARRAADGAQDRRHGAGSRGRRGAGGLAAGRR